MKDSLLVGLNPWPWLVTWFACTLGILHAAPLPDISTVAADLTMPELVDTPPAAGKRVRLELFKDTPPIILYLPNDWKPEKKFPVIIELAGNGNFKNNFGDTSSGLPEGSKLGYGLSGGKGFVWACVPFLNEAGNQTAMMWWGDAPSYRPDSTVAFLKRAVPTICVRFSGDPQRVILCGFSRGAIAANAIGLHDDEIAALWRGFVCYSHYDGISTRWPFAGADAVTARQRLARLQGRPQLICCESTTAVTRKYLESTGIQGDFTFLETGFRNHNDAWALRPSTARDTARKWLANVIKEHTPTIYQDQKLGALDFPIGAVGGSVIRMNGKAERTWWQIFHNHEQRKGSGVVPNSFFAVRTKAGDATRVRALQTTPAGPFSAMQSLTFSGEFPFGWYAFQDDEIPVKVTLEAYNPLIPMDLKNSAIPCAIFRIKVANPTHQTVDVGLLATQQNAVGFSGYDSIGGENQRQNPGFGKNRNQVVTGKDRTGIALTGPKGSMHLSTHTDAATATAAWPDMASLFADFEADGKLTGPATAESPAPQTTVDAALAPHFTLAPGAERSVTFVLSWHFPGGTFGRADIPEWHFVDAGNQYENWWVNATEVDAYVAGKFDYLDSTTRLYHQTLYSSNIPRYALDRLSSNLSVLKSPTSFWTKDGYFGIWESTSDKQEWFGNCKHVIHYAQGHARLFPELGRILRDIDLRSQLADGLFPDRDGGKHDAIDGHFGTILGVYREYLLSTDNDYLKTAWPRTRKAMDYAIERLDCDRDGMFSGSYHNTLDCNSSGTSPWIGSLYIAALKASANMADLLGEKELATGYRELAATAIRNQNEQLWNEQLGYYVESPENLPNTRIMGDAVGIDMFLGQWWANQLGLGQLYPADRTRAGLAKIFTTNRITDPGRGYPPRYRDFLGTGDTGWQMFVHPGPIPQNSIHYYCEVMSGFEYSAAATMIQYGMTAEGMEMVKEISKRYDGRHRGKGEVTIASNATVDGTGSPFGEDECGKYYARAMSSWSVLLALQGFSYDGPQQRIGFQPVWQPEDHASFFSAANGWGLFTQSRKSSVQESALHLKFGTLDLQSITLAIPERMQASSVRVSLDGKNLPHEPLHQQGGMIEIKLDHPITIKAGSSLILQLQ